MPLNRATPKALTGELKALAAPMLSPRKSLFIAIGVILIFLLLRNHHRPAASLTFRIPSDNPAGQPHDRNDLERPSHTVHRDPNQAPLTELSHKPLRSQLSYYFPYQSHLRFPAYIWQTFSTNPASGSFPAKWRPFEASWTENHPGFVHEVITDEAAVHMLRHLYSAIPDVVEAYTSLPQPVLKADFFRYLILLARGGIYTDIDTFAIKSAAEWIPANVPRESFGLVIGVEADPDREDWADWYSRRIQFCQWTIQAKPGHPVLREIVARITEETLLRKRKGELTKYDQKEVVDLTGPAIWTDTVFRYFNDPHYYDLGNKTKTAGITGVGVGTSIGTTTQDGRAMQDNGTITWRDFTGIKSQRLLGDVVVLPITCFSPGVRQMGAGEDDDPMAFVKHMFDGKAFYHVQAKTSDANDLQDLGSQSGSATSAKRRRRMVNPPSLALNTYRQVRRYLFDYAAAYSGPSYECTNRIQAYLQPVKVFGIFM